MNSTRDHRWHQRRLFISFLILLCLGQLQTAQAQLTVVLSPSVHHGSYNVSRYGAADGSISAAVSGGVLPYAYQWYQLVAAGPVTLDTLDGLSGLMAGHYRLVVTDSTGATDTSEVTLTRPSALTANISPTGVTCSDLTNGTAMLYPSGAVTPYTISWDNGDTLLSTSGLAAGVHSVTIWAANGDSITVPFSIGEPSALSVTLIATPDGHGHHIACGSGTTTVSTSVSGGTPPYAYHWNTGSFNADLSGAQAGWHAVQVTDMNNCHVADSLELLAPAILDDQANYLPYPNGTPFSCETCNDAIIQITALGGTPPYTLLWNTGHTGTVLEGMHADSAYWYTLTDAKGCTLQSDTLVTPRGVSFPQQLGVFLFADQYAGGHHVSHSGASDGSIEAVIVGGQPPYQILWSTGDTIAEITGLAVGSYTVTVTDQNGAVRVKDKMLTGPLPLTLVMDSSAVKCNGGVRWPM